MSRVLSVTDLKKSYRSLKAVDGVSVNVEAGDFVGLIGPNGAGKSTLFNCTVGRINWESGSIKINDVDVANDTIGARKLAGFVPQELDLYGYLTGEEYLRFLGGVRGVEEAQLAEEIEELLELCELTEARHRVVKEYSGGMARKLAISGALVGSPPLLLLDESFVGLDPESTHRIQARLLKHRENGGAIVLSSHILDMLERICTRIVMLCDGEKVLDAPIDDVKAQWESRGFNSLTQLYLQLAGKL